MCPETSWISRRAEDDVNGTVFVCHQLYDRDALVPVMSRLTLSAVTRHMLDLFFCLF